MDIDIKDLVYTEAEVSGDDEEPEDVYFNQQTLQDSLFIDNRPMSNDVAGTKRKFLDDEADDLQQGANKLLNQMKLRKKKRDMRETIRKRREELRTIQNKKKKITRYFAPSKPKGKKKDLRRR